MKNTAILQKVHNSAVSGSSVLSYITAVYRSVHLKHKIQFRSLHLLLLIQAMPYFRKSLTPPVQPFTDRLTKQSLTICRRPKAYNAEQLIVLNNYTLNVA